MKTGLLTFEQYHGKTNIGSSRIRMKWLINHWKEVGPDLGDIELYKIGGQYDVMVFQKVYWPEYASKFKGVKILDLCDPDWFSWQYRVKEMIDEVDVITTSTEALAEAVRKFTDKPVHYVPDRVDLDIIKPIKEHKGVAQSVVWYGYQQNFPMLQSALKAIKKLQLDLIVVANKPFVPYGLTKDIDLTNYPWTDETAYDDIARADIVLNPTSKKGHWKYKSNNKTVQAWALGMPVAENEEELVKFIPEDNRLAEVERILKKVKDEYDIKLSVIQMKDIIKEHLK